MILIVTSTSHCARSLPRMEKTIGQKIQLVTSLRQADALIRKQDFSAVVLDQLCLDQEPAAGEGIWKHMGTAVLVCVNFGITGADRVCREVRAALLRRDREQVLAARAAQAALRSQITPAVTGILLSSELALSQPALSPLVQNKLRSVHELATHLRQRLDITT
jgi:hypothetical protein